ncbi:MAG TPA: PIG-L family deacetylase [Candidatus Sulfotelmatobacter sp.]|nr:PIG-L family deacetylase [Candidatus Sulfotelmatobacter sp.]
MRPVLRGSALAAMFVFATVLLAQAPQKINPEDARYKADILVVVAHPDDEAFFTPYLAREIYDAHKRVAVIFSTHGGSGVNRFTRERGPAMANEREIEARDACARLNISNVWFLDGKDTPSQNLLESLSNWGHGENLERLVGLIRLTRPEVILTHYPGVFIGENHGDHQATGVLTIEAFDLAGDPLVFPSQLAGPMNHYESYLSNLQAWQAKKIYFGSDANDNKQFDGSGPAYSVREISPSQKKPYWRLALYSAMAHRTQFPGEIDRLAKMSDAELEKMMNDPNQGWWSEPLTLIFGKSVVGGKPTDDVFAHIDEKPQKELLYHSRSVEAGSAEGANPRMELGGPWNFYSEFAPAHGLTHLIVANPPQIAIKSGSTLSIPLVVLHDPTKSLTLTVTAKLPEGWTFSDGSGAFTLPPEASTSIELMIDTPKLTDEQLKKATPQEVTVHGESNGKPVGDIKLRVLLRKNALPES